MVSNLGKVMDPVADKLLVSSTMIMLAALGWVPAWAVCVIIGRELAVTGLRNIIAQNEMDRLGLMAWKVQDRVSDCRNDPLLMFHYARVGFGVP
jgi:CDP-diacylglycerol--glycerol-3-phosphate 3-phosphatidyltransferase